MPISSFLGYSEKLRVVYLTMRLHPLKKNKVYCYWQ